MKKLALLSLVMVVFVAGCGKKCKKNDTKKVAQSDIPVTMKDNETLLGDNVGNFAFVDEDAYSTQDSVDRAKKTELAAAGEVGADYEFQTVQFNFNENNIKADQEEKVVHNASEAQKAVEQGKELLVAGHTCQIGSAAYNLALSLKRATTVKQELVKNGIPEQSIKTIGKGYESPLVWSDATTREDKIVELNVNRRAEISVN